MSKLIVGVSGSPRAGGNSDAAAKVALEASVRGEERGEFLALRDYHIEHCAGCRRCMTENRCVIEGDQLEDVTQRLRRADGIILASPVYWFSPTGVLKDFMDRTHGWYAVGGIFAGKVAGIISVAADSGFEEHEAPIRAWLSHYGARVVAVEHIYAREMGDLEAAPEEVAKARRIGAMIADAL